MILQTLIVAFVVSYIGSIPPGTINVSVMQMAILNKRRAAVFLAFAASAVEFLYAGVTVQFHIYLNTNEVIADYFRIITSIALIGLGLSNILSKSTSSSIKVDTKFTGRHGFLRGLLLGFLNPMTIPFWLAITTYLENDDWINVDGYGFWMYLIGLAAGTFCLLLTVNALGKRFSKIADNHFLVHKVPGFLLLGLGVYFLLKLVI
ncbi:LysE family translocator [Ekhidna sp. To15]|uniref:LysE family translocator n=1 Tax=Ekhidna sp. To15 TaxID=3395267 RepID=UPI003F524CB9